MLLSWKAHTVIGGVEMSEELKPCPFCGGTKIKQFYEWIDVGDENANITSSIVKCADCLCCRGDTRTSDAIRKWNTRPLEDEKDKEIARLNELMRQRCYDCLTLATRSARNTLIESEVKDV